MIRIELVVGLVTLALWLFCLIEVIRSDEGAIRHLPKLGWLLIVLFFPLAGSIAWLVAGRPTDPARASRFDRPVPEYPEYDRPGRLAATNPEADEAFLRKVRERAEQQRRAYREQQLRRERQERGEADATE
ncbi:MAG TPA: PLDc N-terminal domain-containing protein [Propionibacteriaceae bacterium]